VQSDQTIEPLASSYRDPSGFVFQKDSLLYRQVNKIYAEHFDYFINSGCYDYLVKKQLLLSHEEINENFLGSDEWYKTLMPQKVPFISYPYEWCFDMLKDAALLTLTLARECMSFGIMLKDATPYNVQWLNGKLIFIDTLSFEKYDPSKPWIAYRQFCECFLSPLLLMHYTNQPLQPFLLGYPDGIPLSITKSLLPGRSRFSFHTSLHIHMHQRLAAKNTEQDFGSTANTFSEKKLQHLLDSLQLLIQSLRWKGQKTTWENYYEEARQRNNYLDQKKSLVRSWLHELPKIKTAVDLGANEGGFSKIMAKENIRTIATDFDHNAINNLYKHLVVENEKNILPLVIDLANPSPSIGVNNNERISFIERTNVNLCLALALMHHLSIGKNIPFEKIAGFFAKMTNYLLIEFVPKHDQKINYMLRQKKDIYTEYNEEHFTKAFERHFFIERKQEIADSGRILYQMKKGNL
jgi:hypothetical protein